MFVVPPRPPKKRTTAQEGWLLSFRRRLVCRGSVSGRLRRQLSRSQNVAIRRGKKEGNLVSIITRGFPLLLPPWQGKNEVVS
jgi:hypothetical protein